MLRVALILALVAGAARADSLADGLASDDPKQVAAAVEAIEHAPATTPDLADTLFAAGRACEDTLADPARALALYERIIRETPDARVVVAAGRRAEALRGQLGDRGEHARRAAELAHLMIDAGELDPAEVVRRGDALATAAWPGAPDAGLWLAEWLRRAGRFADAQARYAAIATRFAGTPHAVLAIRGGAGCALDAGDWDRAAQLAAQLPAQEPADRVLRDDLLASAARGRGRARWYTLAWIAVALALAAMLASFVEATRGRRLRPPFEVLFLAPVAAVMVGVALTAHPLIAPAVIVLSVGGLVLAWLSGATLDALRAGGKPVHRRALLHVAACAIAIAALCYIVVTRDGLLDMVIETVRFGPD